MNWSERGSSSSDSSRHSRLNGPDGTTTENVELILSVRSAKEMWGCRLFAEFIHAIAWISLSGVLIRHCVILARNNSALNTNQQFVTLFEIL